MRSKRPQQDQATLSARRWRRTTIGVTGMVIATTAWAYCPPQYQEDWVQPSFQQALQTLQNAIRAMDNALSTQLQQQSERLVSAIAVLTKQKAVAANQIADGLRNSNQEVALGLNALAQAERVKRARFEFGGEFGQGYSPCYVFEGRIAIGRAESDLLGDAGHAVRSEVQAAPGRYASPVLAQKEMLEEHNKLFCTREQAESGLCQGEGKLPGASLSAGTLFKPTIDGEDLTKAKIAFINNVSGLPDGPVPKEGARSNAAAAYQLAKMEKDAVRSSALSSLKQIQLETTGTEKGDHGGELPLSEQYAKEVKRYAGNTDDYKSWARVMAAQNDRGVLVEMLKIKALDLSLQERQYRQWERMESQLASVVAARLKHSRALESNSAGDSAIRQAAKKLGS